MAFLRVACIPTETVGTRAGNESIQKRVVMNETWSKSQKKRARELFDLARNREYAALYEEINSLQVTTPDEVWKFRERLNRKAREMDRKYDYRYSQLLFVFAELVNGGYLALDELSVLGAEKWGAIKTMTGERQ